VHAVKKRPVSAGLFCGRRPGAPGGNANRLLGGCCEIAHSVASPVELRSWKSFDKDGAISNDDYSDDRKASRQDTVEPDVLFVDGIVHDEAQRYCSLGIEDLTRLYSVQVGTLDLQPGDVAANDAYVPQAPVRARSGDERRGPSRQRAGSGWAPFLWMRIKAYFSI
jgi:hypothetical protein